MLISLTRPLARPSAGEDGPRGTATEVTNGESAALGVLRAGRPGAGGRSQEARSWLEGGGQPQAGAWPTCADGASRAVPTALLGGRVGVAGPSSERPEWEKGKLRLRCSGRQARSSSTGSGGPAGHGPRPGEPGQRLTGWGGRPCCHRQPEGSPGAPWPSGAHLSSWALQEGSPESKDVLNTRQVTVSFHGG